MADQMITRLLNIAIYFALYIGTGIIHVDFVFAYCVGYFYVHDCSELEYSSLLKSPNVFHIFRLTNPLKKSKLLLSLCNWYNRPVGRSPHPSSSAINNP